MKATETDGPSAKTDPEKPPENAERELQGSIKRPDPCLNIHVTVSSTLERH